MNLKESEREAKKILKNINKSMNLTSVEVVLKAHLKAVELLRDIWKWSYMYGSKKTRQELRERIERDMGLQLNFLRKRINEPE